MIDIPVVRWLILPRRLSFSLLTAALVMAAAPGHAGVIVIGSGASVSTGAGHIELDCSDAEIAGSLSGSLSGARDVSFGPGASVNGASISLSGDWINTGPPALNAQVDWPDGCGIGESSMLGSSDVASLAISSQGGREIRFDAGGEQRVAENLSLTGTPGQLLRLRASAPSQFARLSLDFGAGQQIDFVDVAWIDSSAGQGIAPGNPEDLNSLRSGPVRNWFVLSGIPIPTLGLVSILLLALLMGLLGLYQQSRYAPANDR